VVEDSTQQLLAGLRAAIIDCDIEGARALAGQAVEAGADPVGVLNITLSQVAKEVGERFECGDYHLPQLVMAGSALEAASQALQKAIPEGKLEKKKVVVIGTVEGDMHSLGKNIVAMMLRASGFEVHDLGVDVRSSAFVRRAQEVKADLIGLSCLLTTTLPYQREVMEDLVAQGLRERFKVLVGGGPVTAEWAAEIGADGCGADAVEAVRLARLLTRLPE
jgi:methanogenic corrinoid protein MtbC1